MESRLERLFSLYSSDFGLYAPNWSDCFGCPLCYKIFRHADPLRDLVAEEHIVPSKLGGRLVTLTCRKCNNDQGSSLEADLIRRVRVETGRYPLAARVRVGDGEFGAQMKLPRSQSGFLEVVRIPKQSDPRKLKAAMKALTSGKEEINFKLSLGYNHLRSLSGLLRAAYLLMFRHFGYSYVLDVSAKRINWQIQNPINDTNVLNGIQWRVQDAIPTALSVPAITVIRRPVESQCFIVILQLDATSNHYATVALPPPGKDGDEFYDLVQSQVSGQHMVNVLNRPEESFLPFIEIWDHLTKAT